MPPADEQRFQRWYAGWADRAGLDPNPDNPLHKYDYRGAFKAGIQPEIASEDGLYHWPSEFKDDDHPNRFVAGVGDTKHLSGKVLAFRTLSAPFSPAQGAEAYAVAGRSGVSPDAALPVLDIFRPSAVPFDAEAFARESPTTAQWLASLANAAVAKGDEEQLGWLERNIGRDWPAMLADLAMAPATKGASLGLATARADGRIPLAAMASALEGRALRLRGRASLFTGGDWAESRLADRIRALEADAASTRERMPAAGGGFIERSLVGAAGALTGSVLEGWRGFVEGAVPAAGVGAAGTWWLGPIAPFTTAGVAIAGGKVGAANAMRELMAGVAAQALDDAEAETGTRFARGDRFVAEQAYGVVGGAIEYLTLGTVGRGLGGQALLSGGVRRVLAAPTVTKALAEGARFYGTNVAEQVLQESLQQGGELLTEHIVRRRAGVEGVSAERVVRELLETAGETAISVALIPLPGVGLSLVNGLAQVQEARVTAERVQALGDGFEAVGLRARSPEAFRQWVTAVKRQEGAISEVYVPLETARTLFQSSLEGDAEGTTAPAPDAATAQVAELVRELGIEESWATAEATGGSVALPLETIAEMAGSPLFKKLTPHLTFRPDGPTLETVAPTEEALTALREEVEALDLSTVTDRREQEVIARGIAQLTATGVYTEQQVRPMVEALYRPFIVIARRFAKANPEHRWADPLRLLQDRNLTVQGPDRAEVLFDTIARYQAAEASGASDVELAQLQVMLDRIADDRVALRTALRTMEQTEGVRDAEGRLAKDLRRVEDEALALEYLTRRDRAAQLRGAIAGIVESPEYVAAQESPTVEEASARIDELALAGAIESATGLDRVLGLDAELRRWDRDASVAERSLPRLERELTARGITEVDAWAAERGLVGDATFDPAALDGVQEQRPMGALLEDVQAFVVRHLGNSPPVQRMRLRLIERDRARRSPDAGDSGPQSEAERAVSHEIRWGVPRAGMAPLDLAVIEEAARLRGLELDPAAPTVPYFRSWDLMAAAGRLAQRGEWQKYDRISGELLEQAAFHGSPHVFDKFTTAKMGTGEGAQAFGWGLYFAENDGIAKDYHKKLAYADTFVDGKKVEPDNPLYAPAVSIAVSGYDVALKTAETLANSTMLTKEGRERESKTVEQIKSLEGKKVERYQTGALYRVDIPDAAVAKFLDWDKPLSEQAPEVREALKAFGIGSEKDASQMSDTELVGALGGFEDTLGAGEARGVKLYRELSAHLGGDEAASKALLAAGIPGIKYLDAGSRSQGEGSRNLVVFDDALVTITHRNGEAVTASERAEFLEQGQTEALPATVDIDGVQRPTTNSNGAPIALTEQGVRNFYKWFGASKVVDAEGRPLVVYHGTTEDVEAFAVSRTGQRMASKRKYGKGAIFFTSSQRVASDYATVGEDLGVGHPLDKPNVIPVYLALGNPREIDAEGKSWALFVEQVGQAQRAGEDGVVFKDIRDHARIPTDIEVGGVDVFVAFKRGQVKSALGNSGAFDPARPSIVAQESGRVRPNAFYTPQGMRRVIGLMETADLSSFAHEMGHEYLSLLEFVAQDAEAPQSITDDLAAALTHLGAAPGSKVADLTTAQQETFARDFERYLLKGDAPSRALARAFERFRVWLTNVYHAIKQMMDVPPSPELAAVFDRLLATDEELAEWRNAPESQPMVLSAEEASAKGLAMTGPQFEAYRTKYDWHQSATGARVIADVLAETRPERKQAWEEMRSGVEAEVTAAVDREPIERAVVFLRDAVGEGDAVTHPNRLDRALVQALYGESATKGLPKGILAGKGEQGLDLDSAAVQFGFRDGTALYQALRRYERRETRIQRLTDEVMAARFPNLLNDSAALTQATEDAAHRSEQDEALLADLEVLGRTLGIEVPTTRAGRSGRVQLEAMKLAARRHIGAQSLLTLDPQRYARDERRAARNGERELRKAKPDVGAVAAFKRQQLLNRLLYAEARKAQVAGDKAAAFFRRMGEAAAQERLGLAGPAYRDAMNAILDGYEFRRTTNRVLDRRALLRDWVDRVRADSSPTGKPEDGILHPAVPPAVLDDAAQVNYREIPLDRLDGLHETGKQVWATATQKDKLLDAADRRSVTERAIALAEEARSHRVARPRAYLAAADRGILDAAQGKAAWAHFALMKPEMILRLLDGDVVNGPWQRTFMRRYADAQSAQSARLRVMADLLQSAMHESVTARFGETVEIPGAPRPVTIETIFALALNLGNDGNREAVMQSTVDGRPAWFANARAIHAMLSALTVEELRAVQAVWDAVDTLWPDIKALEERLVGVAPQRVEAVPLTVTAKDGTVVQLRGGYYPLAYDPAFSDKAKRDVALDEALSLEQTPASYAHAATAHGHTERRVGSGKRPVMLDMRVLTRHVYAAVHDLTHRETVYDASRLLNHSAVADAVTQTFGPEALAELRKQVARVAGEPAGPRHGLDFLLTHARAGVTAVALGWRYTTTVAQFLGVIPALDFLGPKWMGVGVQAMMQAPLALPKMVMEMSGEMRDRANNVDRELRDAGRRKGTLTPAQEGAFFSIMMADRWVATAVWWGAYQQALSENQSPADAVAAADSAMRITQGSGAPKDLASAQAGSPVWRLFTMFASYWSALYGMLARTGTNVTEGRWGAGRAAVSLAVLWMLPGVIDQIVTGRAPDDDDDHFWQWWLWNMTTYPLQTIPGVRDVARAYEPGRGAFFKNLQLSPVFRAAETVAVRVPQTVAGAVRGDELSRTDINNIVNSAGYFLKLPTGQATVAFWNVLDWMTGRDGPVSVQDTPSYLFDSPSRRN